MEQLQSLRRDLECILEEKSIFGRELTEKVKLVSDLQMDLATAGANTRSANEVLTGKTEELTVARKALSELQQQFIKSEQGLALARADNRALEARQQTQLEEIERLQKRFATEFENMANRILESNSQKFTDLNKSNLEAVLGPLGNQISEFREQVNKVYQDE